jgi:hypothetical protein
MLGVIAAATLMIAPQEQPPECIWIVSQNTETVSVDASHIADQLHAGLPLTSHPDQRPEAVICARNSILPQASDWRVISELGIPFFIRSDERLGVLEMVDGRIRYRLVVGEMADAEVESLLPILNALQSELLADR